MGSTKVIIALGLYFFLLWISLVFVFDDWKEASAIRKANYTVLILVLAIRLGTLVVLDCINTTTFAKTNDQTETIAQMQSEKIDDSRSMIDIFSMNSDQTQRTIDRGDTVPESRGHHAD